MTTCKRCLGDGIFMPDVPDDDPRAGKAIKCECRIEVERVERHRKLLEGSGLYGWLLSATLESFRENENREMYDAAIEYDRRDDKRFLLLQDSRPGVGKTHLAAGLLLRRIERGVSSLFVEVAWWLEEMRGKQASDYQPLLRQATDVPFLVLDDLGTENRTEWTDERLYRCA